MAAAANGEVVLGNVDGAVRAWLRVFVPSFDTICEEDGTPWDVRAHVTFEQFVDWNQQELQGCIEEHHNDIVPQDD